MGIKVEGLTVSNWALMEKVKQLAAPIKFVSTRVKLSTIDFVRLETELEHSGKIDPAINALNDGEIKIGGFTNAFKTKAKKATDFPSKNSWDAHFMENAEHYDDTKYGERPDTILFKDVPKRFFSDEGGLLPTEDNIKLAFLTFGQIRNIDVPILNEGGEETLLANQALVAGGEQFNTFSMTGTGLNFDFYVQFMDKIGFERCMDEFRDMKLMHMDENGKAVAAAIKIAFDKSKHLSEAKIMQRQEAIKKAQLERKQRDDERHKKREEEERKLAEKARVRDAKDKEKERRRLDRQAKRREKRLKKKHGNEENKLKKRIQVEERKLLLAQRKLEATRILEKLFDRVAKMKEAELAKKLEAELNAERKKKEDREAKRREKEEEHAKEKKRRADEDLEQKEKELKEKLLKQVGDRRRAKEAEKNAQNGDHRGKDKKSSSRGREDKDDRKRRDKKEDERRRDRNDEKRRKYDDRDTPAVYDRREKTDSR